MQLTPSERKRLKTLRAWHQRPPTWGGLLPKGIALVVFWCVLIVGFAILVAGAGSPAMYYSLGLITFFPLMVLNMIATSVRRWRVNEAIMNWDRVEELLSTADQPGA